MKIGVEVNSFLEGTVAKLGKWKLRLPRTQM